MNDSENAGRAHYETKTVRIHAPNLGRYILLMITRFDGGDHLLGEYGWGSEYYRFGIVSRNHDTETASTGDAFGFVARNELVQETDAEALVKGLEMGRIEWSDIEDGEQIEAGRYLSTGSGRDD